MIDLRREKVMTLPQAASSIKPNPKHVSTLHRWRQKGVRGIRLETFKSGGQRCTTEEALERFYERVTAAADGEPVDIPCKTTRERSAEIAQAERDLEEMDI